MKAHFWTPSHGDELFDWDPDAEPSRFLDAIGHAFLEPACRLRSRLGDSVTIGTTVPTESDIVVASLEELGGWKSELDRKLVRQLWHAARALPVVVVRNDVPLRVEPPQFVAAQIGPSKAALGRSTDFAIPLLPQRGLIRRAGSRTDTVAMVSLKATLINVPEWITSGEFEASLSSLGVTFRLDSEQDNPLRWPDFLDVDITLCVRRPRPRVDPGDITDARKPPTKLVNAWCAGTVPVVGKEVAYLDLVTPDVDALVAEGPESIVDAVDQLRRDPGRYGRMRAMCEERAREFSVDTTCRRWEAALSSVADRGERATTIGLTRYEVGRGAAFAKRAVKSARRRASHMPRPGWKRR